MENFSSGTKNYVNINVSRSIVLNVPGILHCCINTIKVLRANRTHIKQRVFLYLVFLPLCKLFSPLTNENWIAVIFHYYDNCVFMLLCLLADGEEGGEDFCAICWPLC